jgi:hypothetical protein
MSDEITYTIKGGKKKKVGWRLAQLVALKKANQKRAPKQEPARKTTLGGGGFVGAHNIDKTLHEIQKGK